jgi:hypothetical protein
MKEKLRGMYIVGLLFASGGTALTLILFFTLLRAAA